MRRAGVAALAALLVALTAAPARGAGPADRVNPFAGTRPGPGTFGGGHSFPGASAPFGLVQWSPDTTPADRNGIGGYDYRDHHVKGFSLTHLSGAGCETYGDFPFLPTTEPLRSSPDAASGPGLDGAFQPGFSHAGERARPGFYAVRLNPVRGPGIDVALSATTRTGIARFTFGRNPHASVLIDAGGSAQPDDFASVSIDPRRREISGTASSGLFCGHRPRYRVHFAALFDRPFDAFGTWDEGGLRKGATAASDRQAPAANPPGSAVAGAYATFDTRRDRAVTVRVGLSFVSVENARRNLAAESGGAGLGAIAARAKRQWNRALGRIRVAGGPPRLLGTFYTALYHALLAPRTFSDVDGAYIGMDGRVHHARGWVQHADFSGWDVYRTQIQLLAILFPRRASDIVRSLLADAAESGCLPRWSLANGQTMTMVGDSADPSIASAWAFGARAFDRGAALAAMVRGATEPCESANGEYVQRQGLSQYEALGYVPFDLDTRTRNANSIFGDPHAVWGSAAATLEYAIDDFAIAQFAARALGDGPTYRAFVRRSANWRRLFNPASGLIEPRFANGAFPDPYDNRRGAGFVEGNSHQYTWMVPHDPAGLFRKMGGRARAAARLGRFLRKLNGGVGGTHTDHALLGNEPNLGVPWLGDWAGRPYLTQRVVRRALLTLYGTSPDGYPGNDDLGTLSAWYVFGALGLYPAVPGVGVLAIGSPLFERARITLPRGRWVTIVAHASRPAGSARGRRGRRVPMPAALAPYVRGLRIDGRPYGRAWLGWCGLARGARLAFELAPRPNRRWAAGAAAAPPSFGPHRRMPAGPCAP